MLSEVYFKSFCAYVHVAKENLLREGLNFCVCVCYSISDPESFKNYRESKCTRTSYVTLDNETAEKRVINIEVRIN